MYAMKLEGVDKKWQNIGEQHQVRFSNLPAGHYQLGLRRAKMVFTGTRKERK